ncbi:cytochrome bo3 quinol oxidase subunit 4 [Microbulbifer donghaiensis]|uniref:Cytochrome bo(3) ubiquinol oxidase subunit 4 n=1 Tax=Microbulbifer donghaiensis TaxID=494016 RepID=A0A1M4VUW8_9GAMM|nr:cytochrome o ubiquinol oxidase subunit IV [Microbulbifer donghaiensis]SHE72655.1 cytochrome bo3 quinol oxidase subunit 4 [Microbulbifer donghaiensis]
MKDTGAPEKRRSNTYAAGYVLALLLTAIPFGLAATNLVPRATALAIIAIAAILQILVHLRYFLHLRLRATAPERILALAFAGILILIMIGGSLWIMFDLHHRMWI